MKTNKCPNCDNALKKIVDDTSISWVCSKCGYGVSTTTSNPLFDDETIYSIILSENDLNDIKIIKALSTFTGLNYIQTKKLLNSNKTIFSGMAYEVFERKKILDDNNVQYIIKPDFLY